MREQIVCQWCAYIEEKEYTNESDIGEIVQCLCCGKDNLDCM